MLHLARLMTALRKRNQALRRISSRSALLAAGILLCTHAQATWEIELVCPDEFPGPPDCWDCQIFGSTVVYDDDADMVWDSRDYWFFPFGTFVEDDGVNVYNNHFNCDFSWCDVSGNVVVFVGISEFEDDNLRVDQIGVTCSGYNPGSC